MACQLHTSSPVTSVCLNPCLGSTQVSVVPLSNNALMSPYDLSDPRFQSANGSLQFHWRGMDDPTVTKVHYRFPHELQVRGLFTCLPVCLCVCLSVRQHWCVFVHFNGSPRAFCSEDCTEAWRNLSPVRRFFTFIWSFLLFVLLLLNKLLGVISNIPLNSREWCSKRTAQRYH